MKLNFSWSSLYIALLKRGIILLNRKNVPPVLKDFSTLDKSRGSNRYVKDRNLFNGEIIRLLIFYQQYIRKQQMAYVNDNRKYMVGVDRSD